MFWHSTLPFSLISEYFFSFVIFPLTHHYLGMCCSIFIHLWIYKITFFYQSLAIPLWWENILCISSILLNLLRLLLWPNVWSGLEDLPCWEDYVFYCCWKSVLYIYVNASLVFVLLKSCISSLMFCLAALFVIESGVLTSATITVELFIYSTIQKCYSYIAVFLPSLISDMSVLHLHLYMSQVQWCIVTIITLKCYSF